MKLSKSFSLLGIAVAAFFIGRAFVVNINPFAIGFLTATCLAGENVMVVFIPLVMGIATTSSIFNISKYSAIFLLILILLRIKNSINLRGRNYIVSFLISFFTILVNLTIYYFYSEYLTVWQIFIEAILSFSTTIIFLKGVVDLREDYLKISIDNETTLSVMALGTTIIYGMPIEFDGIVVAESFSLFTILYAAYKFGLGVGLSWTVISSAIICEKTENNSYIISWLIVVIAALAIHTIINGGRLLFAFLFSISYYLMGFTFYDLLLSENSQKAVLSALLVFVLAPNSMMIRVDSRMYSEELSGNSPEWGRLVISRINKLAAAFKRIEYTFAGDLSSGIGFSDVGDIIENFTNQLEKTVPLRKTIEARIIEELAYKEVQVKNIILVKNHDEKYEVYINARVRRGSLVTAETIKKIVESKMNVRLELKDESRSIISHKYEMICMIEKTDFKCKTAVRRLSMYENEVSGDNFYIGDISSGQKLILIADGMGNGQKASSDSSQLIDSLEELLSAGFDKDMSIRVVNSYLANKNKGEHFSTLDMLIMDSYTGCGRIYKQGAATTFVKRGEWIELIKSTSLPVGIVEGAVCETCIKKFYPDDFVVMVSDGILESIIFENKEDYMKELILSSDASEPEELADDIVGSIKSLSGNRLKDDATVIVCKIVKSL